MKTRDAVVEGRFYPSSRSAIVNQIQEIEAARKYNVPSLDPVRIFGAVLPHAGHIYSGYQTIPFFQLLRNLELYPETFIIVHPNHTGLGAHVAVADAHFWKNSIGEVPVDRELAVSLGLPFDRLAHMREHSAEVLIPFMQYYLPAGSFSILPVCMMDQGASMSVQVAGRILKAVSATGRRTMVIASCDFSHFLSPDEGIRRDQFVLDAVRSGSAESVELAVKESGASVCGYGPIMVLMEVAKQLHADYSVEILARGHSGEVHPSSDVVQYISMIFYQ